MTLIYNIDTDSHIEIFTGDIVYKMSQHFEEPIGTVISLSKNSVFIRKYNGERITLSAKDLLYFKNKIQYLKF